MKYAVLIYDIPRKSHAAAVQALRNLRKINASMLHHSTWKSGDLKGLVEIAMRIKRNGGNASTPGERLLF